MRTLRRRPAALLQILEHEYRVVAGLLEAADARSEGCGPERGEHGGLLLDLRAGVRLGARLDEPARHDPLQGVRVAGGDVAPSVDRSAEDALDCCDDLLRRLHAAAVAAGCSGGASRSTRT